jgi:DNA polymerase-3 subunit gamma/tau
LDGRRWIVVISQEEVAADTAREARAKSRAAILAEVEADPLVSKLLERFPGSEIVAVRDAGNKPSLAGTRPELQAPGRPESAPDAASAQFNNGEEQG